MECGGAAYFQRFHRCGGGEGIRDSGLMPSASRQRQSNPSLVSVGGSGATSSARLVGSMAVAVRRCESRRALASRAAWHSERASPRSRHGSECPQAGALPRGEPPVDAAGPWNRPEALQPQARPGALAGEIVVFGAARPRGQRKVAAHPLTEGERRAPFRQTCSQQPAPGRFRPVSTVWGQEVQRVKEQGDGCTRATTRLRTAGTRGTRKTPGPKYRSSGSCQARYFLSILLPSIILPDFIIIFIMSLRSVMDIRIIVFFSAAVMPGIIFIIMPF